MRNLLPVFLTFLMVGCSGRLEKSDLRHLPGYWEISKVVTADGVEKEYRINETIDYFHLEKQEGFRKKVSPQFNGKYLENGDAEKIRVTQKEDRLYLAYETPYSEWQEEIISLSEDELVLRSEQGVDYHFRKPQPFSLK